VDLPPHWLRTVNVAQNQRELDALRRSVERGQPFGGERWVKRTVQRLGLEHTFRPRGRPRKRDAD
jgi:putative transposase